MADLDTLRPEVRCAPGDLSYIAQANHTGQQQVDTIHAELLRLAKENAEFSEQLDYAGRLFDTAQSERERAEAELAALKATIFHGIVLDVDDLLRGHAGLPSEWRGKRVRLVVEE